MDYLDFFNVFVIDVMTYDVFVEWRGSGST